MRQIILSCVFALGLPLSALAQASDIKDIIGSQIEAFKVDDFSTAFTFASPTIQQLFGNPTNFGAMVSQGYPMVWRPSSVQYMDLRKDGGRYFQNVLVTDASGASHMVEYQMIETADGWKINGVRIIPLPEANV